MPVLLADVPPSPAEPVPVRLTLPDPVMLLLVSEMPRLDEPEPPTLPALLDTPTKVMLPPVMDDAPASPRSMMPMA